MSTTNQTPGWGNGYGLGQLGEIGKSKRVLLAVVALLAAGALLVRKAR